MNNLTGSFLLVLFLVILGFAVYFSPELISDSNTSLKAFVESELLSILGVIVAITAASASNITLELRRMEAQFKDANAFSATRNQVKYGAYALIILFVSATVIVVSKSLFSSSETTTAIVNGLAVFIFFWNILVLISLLHLSFKVRPIEIED